MFDYVLNYKFYWIKFYYYYLQSGTDIELKLQELRQLGHSQDDLDRIEKIANQSQVVDPQEPPIGRKTSATLLEIERNRQLILVQQGAQVPFNFFFFTLPSKTMTGPYRSQSMLYGVLNLTWIRLKSPVVFQSYSISDARENIRLIIYFCKFMLVILVVCPIMSTRLVDILCNFYFEFIKWRIKILTTDIFGWKLSHVAFRAVS